MSIKPTEGNAEGVARLRIDSLQIRPITELERVIRELRRAIDIAPTDKAAAAGHIERALPYFAEALAWGRKAGAHKKPPGETIGEVRLDMLEQQSMSMEAIAAVHGEDVDVVRRSIERGRKRRAARTGQ